VLDHGAALDVPAACGDNPRLRQPSSRRGSHRDVSFMTQQTAPSPDSGEDPSRRFRDALGMFATGITVVTSRTPAGEPIGLTVNSFNSVSLDPPLIVWSLSNDLPNRPLFEACEYYVINVLAEDQADLSQRFAGRMGDKFAGLEIEHGPDGVPLLKGCCARFVCRNTVRHAGGDHVVFISEVVGFDRDERAPLLYFGGSYRRLAP
jgi:flavin reductase (DIM6/NTAB) family NADH-FMN oxidoreductase RutF